jgi:hypothetical protein
MNLLNVVQRGYKGVILSAIVMCLHIDGLGKIQLHPGRFDQGLFLPKMEMGE